MKHKLNQSGLSTAVIIAIIAVLGIGAVVLFSQTDDSADSMDDDAMMNDDAMMDDSMDDDAMMDDEAMSEEGVEVGGAMMVPSLDIVANAQNADNVTTLVAAVDAAGLVETLQGEGPFTVFAPNNSAFEALPEGTVETLLMPENQDQLASILTYHVVPGRYTAADLSDGQMLTTVQGDEIEIGKTATGITVNGSAMVETADVISSNGVTFVIDAVLLPPEA